MSTHGIGAPGGYALTDNPCPSVAVDTAVLTYRPAAGLLVLQVRREPGPGWALPGTFLRERETLDHAVRRSLREKADVHGVVPRQLHVFDRPGRDDRSWVLSVGHVAVVPVEMLAGRFPDTTRLMPAAAPGRLVFDHQDIIGRALEDLRSRYRDRPDPDRLLGEVFTLRQLRQVHEAVAGAPIPADKLDTFRRRMQQKLIRVPDGPVRSDGRGRPAQLFSRHEAPV